MYWWMCWNWFQIFWNFSKKVENYSDTVPKYLEFFQLSRKWFQKFWNFSNFFGNHFKFIPIFLELIPNILEFSNFFGNDLKLIPNILEFFQLFWKWLQIDSNFFGIDSKYFGIFPTFLEMTSNWFQIIWIISTFCGNDKWYEMIQNDMKRCKMIWNDTKDMSEYVLTCSDMILHNSKDFGTFQLFWIP